MPKLHRTQPCVQYCSHTTFFIIVFQLLWKHKESHMRKSRKQNCIRKAHFNNSLKSVNAVVQPGIVFASIWIILVQIRTVFKSCPSFLLCVSGTKQKQRREIWLSVFLFIRVPTIRRKSLVTPALFQGQGWKEGHFSACFGSQEGTSVHALAPKRAVYHALTSHGGSLVCFANQ